MNRILAFWTLLFLLGLMVVAIQHGKLVCHASYAPSRNRKKRHLRGIPDDRGLKFTSAVAHRL